VRSKSIVWTCAMAIVLCSAGLARADYMNVPLSVGGNYTSSNDFNLGNTSYTNSGGGNITPSTLDGTPLVALYCVDIPHNINVPFTGTAEVNTSGVIGNDSSNDPLNGGLTLANSSGLLTNAGNIAYLLATDGASATSTDQQVGLQAAIWKEVYGKFGPGGRQCVVYLSGLLDQSGRQRIRDPGIGGKYRPHQSGLLIARTSYPHAAGHGTVGIRRVRPATATAGC